MAIEGNSGCLILHDALKIASMRPMTRKKKQRHAKTDELAPELVEHLRELDVGSVRDYFRWCKQHGFKACVDKTWHDLCLEQQFVAEQRVLEKLKRPKKYRKPKTGIVVVYEQNLKPDDVEGVVMKAIATAFEHTKARQPLLELLLYVEARAKLLNSAVYVPALCALNDHRSDWVRPLIEWVPDSYNLSRQFASLLRHLLARYAVPRFMDRAWFGDENEHRRWFIHIGNGHNIRTARGLPVTLTKKMAHHVLQAPDDFTVQEALRWGQARALGGGRTPSPDPAGNAPLPRPLSQRRF